MTAEAIAIIQARMSSSRLPGKVLRPLGGRPTLGWVIRAALASEEIDRVVVATSRELEDDAIVQYCDSQGVEWHRGPLDDVLSRFLGAVHGESDACAIVRLTADCPLLDPRLISMCVRAFDSKQIDYISTTHPRSLPRGLDVEVASLGALRRADAEAVGVDRVHVTSYIYRNASQFRVAGLCFRPTSDDLRLTLDTPEDAELLDAVVEVLGDLAPSWSTVVNLLRIRPELAQLNADVRQKSLEEG